MIYALHHASAILGAALTGAALLHQKAWTRQYPRAAVILWHLVTLSCVLASFGFLVSIALSALGRGVVPALGAVGRGQQSLRALTTVEAAALVSALSLLLAVGGAYASSTLRSRRAQSRQRLLLEIVADRRRGPVTVIDHTAPLVYALPGSKPQIVATTAAIGVLTPLELDAVLAHERHHLSARHDLAILPFAMLRRISRHSCVFLAIEAEVDLLLEMCADDHAARQGHRDALRSSLDHFTAEGVREVGLHSERVAADAIGARRDRLTKFRLGARRGLALTGYGATLTFLATTLSLYVLPV